MHADSVMSGQNQWRVSMGQMNIFFPNQWWMLTCLGIMSSAMDYESRLRFGQKLSHGGPLTKSSKTLPIANYQSHSHEVPFRFPQSDIFGIIICQLFFILHYKIHPCRQAVPTSTTLTTQAAQGRCNTVFRLNYHWPALHFYVWNKAKRRGHSGW